jgi:hypothetical protein
MLEGGSKKSHRDGIIIAQENKVNGSLIGVVEAFDIFFQSNIFIHFEANKCHA